MSNTIPPNSDDPNSKYCNSDLGVDSKAGSNSNSRLGRFSISQDKTDIPPPSFPSQPSMKSIRASFSSGVSKISRVIIFIWKKIFCISNKRFEDSVIKKEVSERFEDSVIKKEVSERFEDSVIKKEVSERFEDSVIKKEVSERFEDSVIKNGVNSTIKIALNDLPFFCIMHNRAKEIFTSEQTLFLGIAQNVIDSIENKEDKSIVNFCLKELEATEKVSIEEQRKLLFNTFIKDGSEFEVNISFNLRKDIGSAFIKKDYEEFDRLIEESFQSIFSDLQNPNMFSNISSEY